MKQWQSIIWSLDSHFYYIKTHQFHSLSIVIMSFLFPIYLVSASRWELRLREYWTLLKSIINLKISSIAGLSRTILHCKTLRLTTSPQLAVVFRIRKKTETELKNVIIISFLNHQIQKAAAKFRYLFIHDWSYRKKLASLIFLLINNKFIDLHTSFKFHFKLVFRSAIFFPSIDIGFPFTTPSKRTENDS